MSEHKKYCENVLSELREKHPFYNNTDLAYEFVLHEILCGNYRPGQTIMQEEVADLLSMSRTPVRDAFGRLLEDHFLEKTDRNSVKVVEIQLRDYADFSDFRMTMETHAAYLAARNISDRQLELLADNVQKTKSLLPSSGSDPVDIYAFTELDMEFHSMIIEASGNQYIRKTMLPYYNKEKFLLILTVRSRTVQSAINKHMAIYEAIRNSDENKAAEAMHSHLDVYIRRYLMSMEEKYGLKENR